MSTYKCKDCDLWTDNDTHPINDKGQCPDCSFEREGIFNADIAKEEQERFLRESDNQRGIR